MNNKTARTMAMLVPSIVVVLVAATFTQSARGPEGLIYEPRDLTKELANKTTGTYTVTAVGDVLMQEPMSTLMSPDLLEVLRGADTTVGNMEVYLVDRRNWGNGFGNNWSPKEMAKDYAAMGFDMLVSGEGAGGEAGMRSSMQLPRRGRGRTRRLWRERRDCANARGPAHDEGPDCVARRLSGDRQRRLGHR